MSVKVKQKPQKRSGRPSKPSKPVPGPVEDQNSVRTPNQPDSKDRMHWLGPVPDESHVAHWLVWSTEDGKYRIIRSVHKHDPEDKWFKVNYIPNKMQPELKRTQTLEGALAAVHNHAKKTLEVEKIYSNWKEVVSEAEKMSIAAFNKVEIVPLQIPQKETPMKTTSKEYHVPVKKILHVGKMEIVSIPTKKTVAKVEVVKAAAKTTSAKNTSVKKVKNGSKEDPNLGIHGGHGRVGIIPAIEESLRKASKSNPKKLSDIVKELEKKFPGRNPAHTVYVQICAPAYSTLHKKGVKICGDKSKGFWIPNK